MKVKKGQTFIVRHKRKGVFKAVATKDFDTDIDEFYPIATLESVRGYANYWEPGDPISCKANQCVLIFEY